MENWLFPYLLPIPKVNSIWKRRWCSGIMQDSHSCDPGSIPGRRILNFKLVKNIKNILPDGELNPGLPRDRRGSLPLDYQGLDVLVDQSTYLII